MSGIARILLDREGLVSGSDAKESRGLHALRARGAEIRIGHDASSLDLLPGGPTAVVTTHAAIPKTNPELVEARRRGIPVILRPAVQKRFVENGMDTVIGSPEELRATILADRKKWADVIKEAGIRAD